MPSWQREKEEFYLYCTLHVFVYAYLIFQYCSQKLKAKIGVFSISIGTGNKNCVALDSLLYAIKLKRYVSEACSQLQKLLSAPLSPH
jgi:hypothetical protein